MEENKEIYEKLNRLNKKMDSITVVEYMEMIKHPRRVIMFNLLLGVVRGLGITVGATLVSSLILYLLISLSDLDLPLIGEYIARIVKIVQFNLQ